MKASKLVAAINARHGSQLTLGERFAGGEQGAYAVREPDGRRLVLKWNSAPAALDGYQLARALTERLHDLGYPVPRYVFLDVGADVAYAVQDELPGAPQGTLRAELLPRLLELNALQAQSAPAPNLDWPGEIVRSILHGCDGYCVIDSLRDYSADTKRLLVALQALAAASADVRCPRSDIVHYDFNPANILVAGGVVSGVIDWDGARSGDCAFDLATLLFYTPAPELQTALWETASAHSSPAAVRLYLAHMIVRQVDWSIRHHGERGSRRALAHGLAVERRFHVTPS